MVCSTTSPLSALVVVLLLLAPPLSAAPVNQQSSTSANSARTSKATPSGVPPVPVVLPVSSIINLVGATTYQANSSLGKAVGVLLGSANGLLPGVLQPRQLGFLGGLVPGLLSVVNGVVSTALAPLVPAAPTSLLISTTSRSSSSIPPSSVSSTLSSITPTTTSTATSSVVLSTTTAPTTTSASPPTATSSPSITCLDSSNNETAINALFYYGGPGTTVHLCPSAVLNIFNPIFFFAANQTLKTLGSPTDSTRATIQVGGTNQSCAIFGALDVCSGIALRNVQIEGSRETLGWLKNGIGLIEFGGSTKGQVIDSVAARNPRGWTAMHIIEGHSSNWCSGAAITNNDVGPSGHAPSGAQQFRRRDTKTYPPGQWSDGISLACTNSLVSGNTITDATDGGIVIFQAPGSKITANTIISKERQLLGGINAVDYEPFGGNYAGTVVDSNTIVAESDFIKIGLAIGPLSWGSVNSPTYRNTGGVFTNNVFKSGTTGYFGYGISVAAQLVALVQGNRFLLANFGGILTPACLGPPYVPPPPGPLYQDPLTTTGTAYQSDFQSANIAFLICLGPSSIQRAGYSS